MWRKRSKHRSVALPHNAAALDVGRLLRIPRLGQPPQVARAHDVQHAITVTNVERPRGASARVAAGDVRSERERAEADCVAVPEPMVDPHLRIPHDPDPCEGPQRQDHVLVITARSEGDAARFARPQFGTGLLLG